MSVTVNGTNGLTFADGSTQATGFAPGMRNRIINGDMRIDQRNAGASINNSASRVYTLDRWAMLGISSNKFSVQQNAGSITPPVGFKNYLGVTSLAATSVGASDYYLIQQRVEGFNAADLSWGTSGAATVSLSFWVRSSLTGTFGGAIRNSAGDRSYPFSFAISAANTWEQKTVIISGDTTGTWLTDNGIGFDLAFGLGNGSTFSGTANTWQSGNYHAPTGATSVVGTNGATFYITGVQLEKGSVATPFEYRHYGQELALCQRYYCYWGGTVNYARVATGFIVNSTNAEVEIPLFPVQMRASPSLGYSAVGDWSIGQYNSSFTCTSINIGQSTPINCAVTLGSSGMTSNYPAILNANNTINARLTFSAEL